MHTPESQDHDLLIEIKANVANLAEEVRLMRDDTKERVKNLENTKLSISEYQSFKLELAKESLRFDNEIKEIKKKNDLQDVQNQQAMKYIYLAMGGLFVIQALISFINK